MHHVTDSGDPTAEHSAQPSPEHPHHIPLSRRPHVQPGGVFECKGLCLVCDEECHSGEQVTFSVPLNQRNISKPQTSQLLMQSDVRQTQTEACEASPRLCSVTAWPCLGPRPAVSPAHLHGSAQSLCNLRTYPFHRVFLNSSGSP